MSTPTIVSRRSLDETPREPGTARPGDQAQTAAELAESWKTDPRWNGICRDYSAEDVIAAVHEYFARG